MPLRESNVRGDTDTPISAYEAAASLLSYIVILGIVCSAHSALPQQYSSMTLCFLRFLSCLQWRKAGGGSSPCHPVDGCDPPGQILEGAAGRTASSVRLPGHRGADQYPVSKHCSVYLPVYCTCHPRYSDTYLFRILLSYPAFVFVTPRVQNPKSAISFL